MREVGILKKDPDTLKDQISKLEAMSKFIRRYFCCLASRDFMFIYPCNLLGGMF